MMNFLISTKKWILLSLLFLAFCIFYYFDFANYFTLATIKSYQYTASQWTDQHYLEATLIYLLMLSLLVACGIPCATVLTLLGGFLFGTIALVYAIVGTTLGGCILFYAIRSSIGEQIAKSSGWIKNMEHGFQQNAFNYLLMLRLVPIFPCGVTNIAAGALNISLKIYVAATVIGIFPATFIYVMLGRGLDKFLSVQSPTLALFFTPSIFFSLLGLAILSILPVIYRGMK